VSATGSATQSGNPNLNFSSANFEIVDYVGTYSGTKYDSQNITSSGATTFSDNQTVYMPGGDVLYVNIQASSTVYVPGGASASVDPQISIAPTYLAGNPGVSLEFSPYIFPVPEPSITRLFTLGSGLAGLFVIRWKFNRLGHV